MALTKIWTREAYVSEHLVRTVLTQVVPKEQSEWYPEHEVSPNNRVDFYIKDNRRKIEFFIEVKAAKTLSKSGLDDAAVQQLATYLQRSTVKYGILIDPFRIQCYQVKDGYPYLTAKFAIEDPKKTTPITKFLQQYLDNLTDMRIIAIHASKGGVGKTTLTTNLAFELARRGNRVLVVDLDEQANTSLSLGVNKADEFDNVETLEDYEKIIDSFRNRKEVIDFMKENRNEDFDYRNYIYSSNWNEYLVQPSVEEGEPIIQAGCIDVLPSSHRTRVEELQQVNASTALRRGLRCAKADYEYVIVDTTPMFNLVTENALLSAQYIIIPSQMEYLSAFGIRQPVKFAHAIAEDTDDEHGNIVGIVPMMVDRNSRNNKAIKDLVKQNFKNIPLLKEISRATAVGQAQYKRVPLFIHAEKNKNQGATVAKQVADLTQQIIERIDALSSN